MLRKSSDLPEALVLLAKQGCDINARTDSLGHTPLHLVLAKGCRESVDDAVLALLKLGAEPDTSDQVRRTKEREKTYIYEREKAREKERERRANVHVSSDNKPTVEDKIILTCRFAFFRQKIYIKATASFSRECWQHIITLSCKATMMW